MRWMRKAGLAGLPFQKQVSASAGQTRVLKLYLVNKGEISLMLPLSAAALWMSWTRRGVWVSEPEILLCLQPGSQLKLALAASDVGKRMGDYIEYGEEMNFKLTLTFKL